MSDEESNQSGNDGASTIIHNPDHLPKYNPSLTSQPTGATIDESHKTILRLDLVEKVVLFSFPDTTFTISVILKDQFSQPYVISHSEEPIKLGLKLVHADTMREVGPGVFCIESDRLCIGQESTCDIQLKIFEDIKKNLNFTAVPQKYFFKIFSTNYADIEEFIVGPTTIIRHKLEVRSNQLRPIPKEWYKDEGGRENCIEMNVHLLDRLGQEVTDRRVKLRLLLLYENLDQVQNQEILKLSPDCKMVIDEEGKAMLKLRIEEVSKNHQKQPFRIKVEPDTEDNPTVIDISSDVSPPISVFSKRIKKSKVKKKDAAETNGILDVANGAAAAMNRYCGFGEKSSDSGFPSDSPAQQSRTESKGEPWDANTGTVQDILNAISNGHREQLSGAWRDLDLMAESSAGPALYNALKSVIQWTGTVVSGLTLMQWQQLGFEIKPDGNPDYSRPLYKMENPNNIIDTIIRQYAHETMQNLLVLLKHVEAGGHNYNPEGSELRQLIESSTLLHSESSVGQSRHTDLESLQRPSKRICNVESPHHMKYENVRYQSVIPQPPPNLQSRMHSHFDSIGNVTNKFNLKEAASTLGRNHGSRPSSNARSPSYASNGGSIKGTNSDRGFSEQITWEANGGHQMSSHRRREEEIDSHNSPLPTQPPSFHPQSSFMWGDNGLCNPPLLSQKSMQVLFDKSVEPSSVPQQQPPTHQDLERHVHYILAKNFKTKRLRVLGLPAYDSQRFLLGFYNMVESQGGESRMVLTPIERVSATKEEFAAANAAFQEEQERGSHSLFDLQHFMSFEKMKEEAGIYYWKKMSK